MATAKKKKPTIEARLDLVDERLEALLSRHEALTQTVEIIAGMQVATEQQITRLGKFTLVNFVGHNKRLKKLEKS